MELNLFHLNVFGVILYFFKISFKRLLTSTQYFWCRIIIEIERYLPLFWLDSSANAIYSSISFHLYLISDEYFLNFYCDGYFFYFYLLLLLLVSTCIYIVRKDRNNWLQLFIKFNMCRSELNTNNTFKIRNFTLKAWQKPT